jgi:hypothetical protein
MIRNRVEEPKVIQVHEDNDQTKSSKPGNFSALFKKFKYPNMRCCTLLYITAAIIAFFWICRSLIFRNGFPYVVSQCVFKSVWSVDRYFKSGIVFDSPSAVLNNVGSGFLSKEFPTDKKSLHSYMDSYDRIMAPYRGTARATVLEIGVKKGGSIKLWREYFQATAMIYGMDIDPGVPTFVLDSHIKIMVLDSSSKADVFHALGEVGSIQFDVIVDDGCHLVTCIGNTYANLKPYLSPTGVYIVEDFPTYAYDVEGGSPLELFGSDAFIFDDAVPTLQLVVVAHPGSLARPALEMMRAEQLKNKKDVFLIQN